MKLSKMAMGLFTLFLLCNGTVRASIVSDVGHAIDHVMHHPVDSATQLAKIAAKGFVVYQAGRLILKHGCKGYEKLNIDMTLGDLNKAFKSGLVCFGLVLLTCESFKSLMHDVKALK